MVCVITVQFKLALERAILLVPTVEGIGDLELNVLRKGFKLYGGTLSTSIIMTFSCILCSSSSSICTIYGNNHILE